LKVKYGIMLHVEERPVTGWGKRIRMAAHSNSYGRRSALALAALVLLGALAVSVACGGGKKTAASGTATAPAATSTPAATRTPGANAGLQTPIAVSPGDTLTAADLAARGVGVPGRGEFTGDRLLIPAIGVDAPFSDKVVPASGQMPNPNGPEDIAWYDFSGWPGLGGLPGKGGNVVLAGHVDYIRYGPAVLWRLRELKLGDLITIRMKDGTTYNYKVELTKLADPNTGDWSKLVEATADESVTLITCEGVFKDGGYNLRRIVWGRRI